MITPAQCRAARALLDWSRERLAEKSRLGLRTVVDFERGARVPREVTADAIRRALEEAGVEFINGGEPGVKLRRRLKKSTMTAEHFKLLIERVKDRLHSLPARGGFKLTPTLELHPTGAILKLGGRAAGALTFESAKELYRTADQYDVDEIEAWITSIARRGKGLE